MFKPKWTPGPWMMETLTTSDPNGDEWETYVEVTAEIGAFIHSHDLGYTDEVDDIIKANARLIAAAPDLYEALAKVLKQYDDLEIQVGEPTEMTLAYASGCAALAKARGETK